MIYDNSLKIDYMAGIEYLERDLNCDQIGIILDNADWEYPFWVLLSDNFRRKIRIEHVNVYNQSGIFEDLTFTPCAVMYMTVIREEFVKIKNGALYKQVFDSEQLSIYSP
jgi:sulfur relay (sulfurtransferase) DsrC/TusE family protein